MPSARTDIKSALPETTLARLRNHRGAPPEHPAVSIIIPVCNAEKYLNDCLASVFSCAERMDVEVVCVDDGSADDSLELLQEWAKVAPSLRVVRQANQGAGVARNAALDIATGEYVFFLDADDRFAPGDALLRAYEQARRDGLDVLLADASNIAEDGHVLQTNSYLNRGLIPQEPFFAPDALGSALFLCVPQGPAGKLFRRAFLEENKLRFPALKRSEDFPMIGLALALSSRIGVLLQSLFEHRTGVASSLESTKDETPLIFFEAEQILRDSLKQRGLWNRFKTAVYSAFVSRLEYNLQAVLSYQSFLAIIDKYRQEQQQWISWEDVDLPESLESKQQLVKDVAKAMDDDDRIALFVKVRESETKRMVSTFWKAKVTKRDERIAQLQKQLGATREVRDAALKERDSLRRSLDATREVRDAALKDRDSLRGNLDATRVVRDAALKERDTLRKSLDATREVRDAALKERDSLRGNLDATRAVRDAALKERDSLRGTLDATREVRDAALKERDSLRGTLDATREVRDAALRERDMLRGNLDATREVRDAALKERDSLRGTLDATRAVRDAALKERNSLKKTLEAVRAVRDTALRERDALRANIASAAKSRDGAIAERNAVRRELDALRKVFGEVEKICGIEKGDA